MMQTRRRRRTSRVAVGALSAMALAAARPTHAIHPEPRWEESPYRIRALVAVDDAVRPEPGLESQLIDDMKLHAAALAPLWRLSIAAATSPGDRRLCFELPELDLAALPAAQLRSDKLMWLAVSARVDGYLIACREFDAYLRRWGPQHERLIRQRSFVAHAAVELLSEAFAPLARIEPIGEEKTRVRLVFRGSALPGSDLSDRWIVPGQPLAPVLRRVDRSGRLATNGVVDVPWTYLRATRDDDRSWSADVVSGIGNPFLAKRRGLVEQVAIVLNYPHAPARVRFHARSDASRGLAGYEVLRESPTAPPERIGVTRRDGTIDVPPGPGPISMLLLRSEGAVLARLPVVAGAPHTIESPIADDTVRLEAQAEARVVREELIDVVARRTIMIARIKAMLKAGKVDDARQLMTELDQLPTASTFAGLIDRTARRLPESTDPQVQKAIERLFASTRELLARYLDPRVITSLQNEVNAAGSGG